MIKLYGRSRIMSGDESLCVTRWSTQIGKDLQYVDGKPVKQPPVSFNAKGNIQPIMGRDLQYVPEGDRFKENFWLFMPTQEYKDENGLMVIGVPVLKINDMISRLDKNYQVQTVEPWGSYSQCRIMLNDVGPNATPS